MADAPRPIRAGFVLLSPSRAPIPSTRIAALNVFPPLRDAGIDPCILFEPAVATETPDLPDLIAPALRMNLKIVVFQKVHGRAVLEQARRLREHGIRTAYLVCDLVEAEMAAATDATVAVTAYLRSLYPPALQSSIHVVHDGIEHPEVEKTEWRQDTGSTARPLHAVLVTSAELYRLPVPEAVPDWLRISIVGNYPPADRPWQRLRRARWALAGQAGLRDHLAILRFLANRRIRRVAWDPVGVYDSLHSADLAIIPIDRTAAVDGTTPPAWRLKSENRLTMKMAVGLPVVATPSPAYEAVIDQGANGFLAESRADWTRFLERLRDPELRRSVGCRARASVIERFSTAEQGLRLAAVLKDLCHG